MDFVAFVQPQETFSSAPRLPYWWEAPKENKTFLIAKTSHCDHRGLGGEGSLGVVLPQRGTIRV